MTTTDRTDPKHLISGYQLCASTEGNSTNAIQIVVRSIDYFQKYLESHQKGKLLTDITRQEIREYISYLQHMKCFASHLPSLRSKEICGGLLKSQTGCISLSTVQLLLQFRRIRRFSALLRLLRIF